MKVYLSGPMSGYENNNFPLFCDTAKELRAKGFDVVNPAEIEVESGFCGEKDYYNKCMRADIKAMMDCEAIALMDGWEASAGANLELHIAHRVGMKVLFVGGLLRGW